MTDSTAPATTPSNLASTIALGDVQSELAITRRALERVPDEHLGWRPHERSWTLAELAGHIAQIPCWGAATLSERELDLIDEDRCGAVPNRAELLRRYDANAATLTDLVTAGTDDSALLDEWTLRRGEQVLERGPRWAMARRLIVSHLVHHRAQLGVYLRLLGTPVPPVYGPSADERPTHQR